MEIGYFSNFSVKHLKVIKANDLTFISMHYFKSFLTQLLSFCFYYTAMKFIMMLFSIPIYTSFESRVLFNDISFITRHYFSYIFSIFVVYSQHIRSIFVVYSQYIRSIFVVYSQYIRSIFVVNSQYIRSVSIISHQVNQAQR